MQSTAIYTIRRQHLAGKPHIIVPVVMMVEGVHSGSHGAILHYAAELEKSFKAWEGIPVTIMHPEVNGRNVSANSPGVSVVGFVFNAHMDGTKLRAEAWLDEQKLVAISPLASAYISQGRPLDVSIGVYTEEEPVQGEWNGEYYIAIARNHIPDHLALLPGETGACSWNDGCGVRANKKGGVINKQIQLITLKKKGNDEMTNDEIMEEKAQSLLSLQVNRLSINDRLQALSRLVDAMDVKGADGNLIIYHILEEAYDEYVIYRKVEAGPVPVQGSPEYFKQAYQVTAENEISFVDSPVKVRKEVNFIQINSEPQVKRTIFSNNKNENQMTETPSPCVIKKVDELIANSLLQFTPADKEWLLTVHEVRLDRMTPKEVAPPPVTAEQVTEYLQTNCKTVEEVITLMPAEMKGRVTDALTLQDSSRHKLIETIVTNASKGTWTKDELSTMSLEMLTKIYKTVQVNTINAEDNNVFDFSAMGNLATNRNPKSTDSDDVLLPTGYGI